MNLLKMEKHPQVRLNFGRLIGRVDVWQTSGHGTGSSVI